MQNSNIKVSVIIPIYNVELYIEACVRSLMNQTLKSGIEFIFVNDGSTDDSINILTTTLSEYPTRKKQVTILHQQNKGLAAAREFGVTNSRGEYIIHCDSDDWVDENMYEILYNYAKSNDAEIVYCDIISEGKHSYYRTQQLDILTSESILGSIAGSKNTIIHGSVCNKLIKARLYQNLRFSTGINYCEDVYMLFQVFKEHRKIVHVPRGLYHYRVVHGSLVHTFPKSRPLECIALMNQLTVWRNETKFYWYKLACESKIASLIWYLCYTDMQETRKYLKQLLPYADFIKSNNQLTKYKKRYLNNFLRGNFTVALIQANIDKYYLILCKICKKIIFIPFRSLTNFYKAFKNIDLIKKCN